MPAPEVIVLALQQLLPLAQENGYTYDTISVMEDGIRTNGRRWMIIIGTENSHFMYGVFFNIDGSFMEVDGI